MFGLQQHIAALSADRLTDKSSLPLPRWCLQCAACRARLTYSITQHNQSSYKQAVHKRKDTKALKEDTVLRIRLQSYEYQVHLTVLQ